jgi:Protein of unknown function (DUF1353)
MHAAVILTASLLLAFPSSSVAAGSFSGHVKAEWNDDGRTMTLLDNFEYLDPQGRKWVAPKGQVVDGASIPRFAWTLIGGPFEGKYRDSSVIHDVGCDKHWAPWQVVHDVFYMGMITSGVEEWRAKVMYAAVYHFGPRWEQIVRVSGIPATQTPVARQRALEGAEPGSTAEILSVEPPVNPPLGPKTSTFTIRVAPPRQTMTQEQFDALRKEIEDAAAAGQPTRTLESIKAAGR